MRGSAPLSNEVFSLVLDIYLGGVSGAIVKNDVIEHALHTKTPIPEENTVIDLLQKTESLLRTTLDNLVSKKQIAKTYIFIDAPLSYTESHEILYQKDDKSFFETKSKELENGALVLPKTYSNLLQEHVSDGIVIEHPPMHHTLNGYRTQNLSLLGERKANVSQQWIQRIVYTAIQKVKKTYPLGEIVFLASFSVEKNGCTFLLGDVVSTLYIQEKRLVVGAGTRLSVEKVAKNHGQPSSHVESTLKSIERDHSTKDKVYTEILNDFSKALSRALKKEEYVNHGSYVGLFVGEPFMFSVTKDALSLFENIQLKQLYKDANARLLYIVKNRVQ